MSQPKTDFSDNVKAYMQFVKAGNLKNVTRRLAMMKNLGKYENEIGTEFASFSLPQMKAFYDKYVVRMSTTQGAFYLTALNDYLVWLLDNGKINGVQFAEHPLYSIVPRSSFSKKIMAKTTSRDIAKQISPQSAFNSMLFSPDDMKGYCETFFSNETSRMERAVHCLIWNGVPIKFVKTIRRDMVDKSAKTVTYLNDKNEPVVVPIKDAYSMETILEASHSDGCNKVGKFGNLYFVPYQDKFSEYLIRPLKSGRGQMEDEENRIRGILFHVSSKVKRTQKELPADNAYKNRFVSLYWVYNSGRYYRFWLKHKNDFDEEKQALDAFWGYGLQNYLIWKSAKPDQS